MNELMNEYLFTEYLINIQKDIQNLYVAYIKNILITKISNIYNIIIIMK